MLCSMLSEVTAEIERYQILERGCRSLIDQLDIEFGCGVEKREATSDKDVVSFGCLKILNDLMNDYHGTRNHCEDSGFGIQFYYRERKDINLKHVTVLHSLCSPCT
jgi:hypothetical protein